MKYRGYMVVELSDRQMARQRVRQRRTNRLRRAYRAFWSVMGTVFLFAVVALMLVALAQGW
jgi:hypothetical protein